MSLPAPGGPRPPLWVLGVGFIAVAVGLIGVGVVTAASGPSDTVAAPPSSVPPTPVINSTTSTTAITTPPSASPTTPPVTTTPASTAPPSPVSTSAAAPTRSTVQPSAVAPVTTKETTPSDVPVRVFNNSTITGLGEKAARELRASGWQVVEVGNFQGRFPTTTVYYQSGTGQEVAARKLASSIKATAAPRINEIASYAPGLIVVVTSDFAG